MQMKIKKTIDLPIEIHREQIYVRSAKALTILLGSTGVSGNHHIYGVKKEKGVFIVDKSVVESRVKYLTQRINAMKEKKELIEEILKKKER